MDEDEQAASALDFLDQRIRARSDATYDARAMAELPQTIPQLVTRAAERFGDLEAVVDGDVRLSFSEFAAAIDVAARALIATGIEAGDRVAIWAPNMYEWAVAALATHTVGGIVIPLNTRFKGAEAGYVIGAAKARLSVHRHRLSRHRLRRAVARRDGHRIARGDRRAPRNGARRLHRVERLPGARRCVERCRRCGSARRSSAARRPVPTSCSRPARRARRRARCCSTRRASARTRPGPTSSDLREGDRYLVINPFFHSFGLKAGILACLVEGRDARAAPDLRRALGHAPSRGGTHHDAARSARHLPDDPQPSRPRHVRPVVVAAGGDGCGADHRRR